MRPLATLSLTPGPDTLTEALEWLRMLALRHDWPQDAGYKLCLCLDEALNNVLQHGGLPIGRTGAITLTVLQGADTLALDLVDAGPAFDPTTQTVAPLAPSIQEAPIGGHGLRLMRHFLQDIQYSRTGGHNRLRLILACPRRAGAS